MGDGRGADEQIPFPHGDAFRGELGPQDGVDPRDREIDRKDREPLQQPFDEPLALNPPFGVASAMDAVEKLGRRNHRECEGLIAMIAELRIEIEESALGGDQDGRVDQLSHGDGSMGRWPRAMRSIKSR